MRDPQEWLFDFFRSRGTLPAGEPGQVLHVDIFDAGLVDSFGVVELITGLETEFRAELSGEDLDDPRLRTMSGLLALIAERRR